MQGFVLLQLMPRGIEIRLISLDAGQGLLPGRFRGMKPAERAGVYNRNVHLRRMRFRSPRIQIGFGMF